jgi:hypothetical protein
LKLDELQVYLFFGRSANERFLVQGRTVAPAAFNGVRTYASDAKATPTEVSSILEQRIRGVQEESGLAETGRVLSVGYVAHFSKYQQTWGIPVNINELDDN